MMKKRAGAGWRAAMAAAFALMITAGAASTARAEWQRTGDGGWCYTNYSVLGYATGWDMIDGKWYYFDSSGHMQTGWIQDGEKWYYLNSDGTMAADRWIDGYYVDGSGAWVPNVDRGKIDIGFTGFDMRVRQDIDGDGIDERLTMVQTYDGVKLSIEFLEKAPMEVEFRGVHEPYCKVSICDMGAGPGSVFVQVPTVDGDKDYWAKFFVNTDGVYTEVPVPDYTFSGWFMEDNEYQIRCDNTAFTARAESENGEEYDGGVLVYSVPPMEYQLNYDGNLGKYTVEIVQKLYSNKNRDKDDEEIYLGAVRTVISYSGSGWVIERQGMAGI